MIDLLTHNVTPRERTFQAFLPLRVGSYPGETLGHMLKARVSGFFLSQVHYVAFPAIRPQTLELALHRQSKGRTAGRKPPGCPVISPIASMAWP
jgi:hypothetical protein